MYSWGGDTSDWAKPASYKYDATTAAKRDEDAKRAKATGPRTYGAKSGPNEKVTTPQKKVASSSKNPMIIAVDVTGSMASWPREIFDRLPLLYQTLSQYRPDLEICFAAIGDARADTWPLQTTAFAGGFDLEQLLGSIHGEGGGGDAPEGYGLFAHWVNENVSVPNGDRPFLIVFGDITMHRTVEAWEIEQILGIKAQDVDAIAAWQRVAKKWDAWFLRRPGGTAQDDTAKQWKEALGEDRVFHIDDEQRAVDYAMAIVARAWGRLSDFEENLRARQDESKVKSVTARVSELKVRALVCPSCGAAIPKEAFGRFTCKYCASTLSL